MLLEGMIIASSLKFRENRTTSACYNILIGKKSVQTIQDVHLYGLDRLYGVYKKLERTHYQRVVQHLLHEKLLVQVDSKTVKPTKKGAEWLKDQQFDFRHFNGLHYHAVESIFIRRLLLLIQTMTNAAKHHFSFIPIEDDRLILNWVKSIYQHIKHPEQVLETLYDELSSLLSRLSDNQAGMFVDRITGFQHYGSSTRQLSETYDLSVHDVHLNLTLINHRLIQMINTSDKHSFLQKILTGIEQPSMMSQSAVQTYHMINKHYSPEEIALTRNLKVNTIYDHIVEIIYFDSTIPLAPYISDSKKDRIAQVIQQTASYRLRDIKQQMDEDVSYFQIRLTIAVMQREGELDVHRALGETTEALPQI